MLRWKIMPEMTLGYQLVTLMPSCNPKIYYCYLASNSSERARQVYCFVNPNDV